MSNFFFFPLTSMNIVHIDFSRSLYAYCFMLNNLSLNTYHFVTSNVIFNLYCKYLFITYTIHRKKYVLYCTMISLLIVAHTFTTLPQITLWGHKFFDKPLFLFIFYNFITLSLNEKYVCNNKFFSSSTHTLLTIQNE